MLKTGKHSQQPQPQNPIDRQSYQVVPLHWPSRSVPGWVSEHYASLKEFAHWWRRLETPLNMYIGTSTSDRATHLFLLSWASKTCHHIQHSNKVTGIIRRSNHIKMDY